MHYPYRSLHINNREVLLDRILSNQEPPHNPFETSTFLFLQQWFSGQVEFQIQTSGSTGSPKTIVITRDQMIASANLTANALHLKLGYSSLICLDTQYIAGKMMLVRCLVIGMKMVLINPSANPFKNLLLPYPIDFAALVPYQLYEVIRSKESIAFNTIKSILIGGSPLDLQTRMLIQNTACQFYATFGMTETISHIALQLLNGANASETFQTLPGIHIALDERGCLIISAPHLPETIITNDLVEIVTPNQFIWLGRYDSIINTGGIKVIPEKLEQSIKKLAEQVNITHPFFIAGLPDAQLGNKIVLIMEGPPLSIQEIETLQKLCERTLSPYEHPKEIICLPTFCFTKTGKMNRQKTIEKLQNT